MNTVLLECTVPEKILLAAHHLEEHGQSPFSAEALIVLSWQKFPRTFGLKGYAELYPDSNKILSCIMGERGLARRGWLAKMGQKLYSLSKEGRHVVQRLLDGGEPPTTTMHRPPVKFAREHEKQLLACLESSAVQKFEEEQKDELTFADACRFWNITENLHGDALASKLDRIKAMLLDVEKHLGTGNAELPNGRSISKEDLNLVTAVHEYLEDRFSRHLTLLRNRVGRS